MKTLLLFQSLRTQVFDLLIERFFECKVEDRNNEPSKNNNVRAFAKMLIDCLLKFMLFKTNVSPEKNNEARLIFRIQFFQNVFFHILKLLH